MQPAEVRVPLVELEVEVLSVLEHANTPTAGPPIEAEVDGDHVVFRCATWRPILRARLDDAIAAAG